jgi:DNA helicase-2/ATP-dependent DNA helicase PcrA
MLRRRSHWTRWGFGNRTNLDLPDIYRRYEELREEARALTFDDFIPKAFELLEKNERFVRSLTNRIDHLIVDEYQDINYGQQRLIQLLAGDRADVMVVGDDDQTIYEWRAARPYYILEGFREDFSNKPVVDYTLSHSFRFGPLLAQVAYNTVTHNEKRNVKPLVAHDVQRKTGLTVIIDESEQATNVAVSMADEISTLVRSQRVSPADIVVLGRTFVQLEGLQAVFVEQMIPFRVLGMVPFFERDENRTLIDYVRLALTLEQPIGVLKPWRQSRSGMDAEEAAQARSPSHYRHTNLHKGPYGETVRAVLAVANTPSRRLPRRVLASAVEKGGDAGFSLWQVFDALLDIRESPISEEGRENLREWMNLLVRVGERVQNEPDLKAGELLSWLVESLDYYEHFTSYYGKGSPSIERISAVRNFVNFAVRSGKAPRDFISYLSDLDTTFGLTANQIITMTTVHRTKGLEYDYVFIPTCVEGHMPVHIADEVAIYDKEGIVPDQPLSPALESERRLFYVAITRTRKHLFIGTTDSPRGGAQAQSSSSLPSRFIEEMEVDATKEMVGALWEALNGDDRRLQAVVHESKARRQVIESVVGSYLQSSMAPHVGQNPSFCGALAHMPDQPFQYSHDYPALEVLSTRSKAEEVEPVEWQDPWAGIGDF